MGMVEESERYLRSIDELLIPSGMRRNEILREKEIHVDQLENVVETLLQNFLASGSLCVIVTANPDRLIHTWQNESDDDTEVCMDLARQFFRGCTVLAFLHSHFDRQLARCAAKEALEILPVGKMRRMSDAAWTESMTRLESYLEIMGTPK